MTWPLKTRPQRSKSKKPKAGDKTPKTPVERPPWDDTIHDLSNMRLTAAEQALRAKARLSRHMTSEAWFIPLEEGGGGGEENATAKDPVTGRPQTAPAIPFIPSGNPPRNPPRPAAFVSSADVKGQGKSAVDQTNTELRAAATGPNRPKKPTVREILHKPTVPPPATHVDFNQEIEDRKLFTKRREERAHHSPRTATAGKDAPPVPGPLAGQPREASPAGPMPVFRDPSESDPSARPPPHLETPQERALREQLQQVANELALAREEREQLQREFEKVTEHSTSLISTLQSQVHALLTTHTEQQQAALERSSAQVRVAAPSWDRIRPDVAPSHGPPGQYAASSSNYALSNIEPVPHRPVLGPRGKPTPGAFVQYDEEEGLPSFGAQRAILTNRLMDAGAESNMEQPLPISYVRQPQNRFQQAEDGRTQAYSIPTTAGQHVWEGPGAKSEYGQKIDEIHSLTRKAKGGGSDGFHQPSFLQGGSGPSLRDPLTLGLGPAPRTISGLTFSSVSRSATPKDSFALSVHIAANVKQQKRAHAAAF